MSTRNYSPNWTATFLAEAIVPEGANLTAAFVVAFTDDGKIVAILQPRGLSIPGGHIDPGETPEQGAKREAFEEAMITGVSDFTLTSVIRGDVGHMLAYTADLISMDAFIAENTAGEVLERIEMYPEDFLEDARIKSRITHEIVRRAVLAREKRKCGEIALFEELVLKIGE